jgi:pyrroline-5-carboxylate reductase
MKIGFIGTGNMATAMLNGIINSKIVNPNDIYVSDCDTAKLDFFRQMGIHATTDNKEVAKNANYVFLTVKPQFYRVVLDELAQIPSNTAEFSDGQSPCYITVAPGITTNFVEDKLGNQAKVVRTMPNTPALVSEGVTAVCHGKHITDTEYLFAKSLIATFSEIYEMDEQLLDPIISVSGSSPAYVYMFIEAIARSGQSQGIAYQTSLKMAAKTVLGSAKLLLNSDEDPEILIDRVCSKGGTTIEAVNYLKENNFSDIIDKAMQNCTKRALELKK